MFSSKVIGCRHASSLIAGAMLIIVYSLISAPEAVAGRQSESATCFNNVSSSYCFGTFAGFRNHPEPDARATFSKRSDNSLWFSAVFRGNNFFCSATSASPQGVRDLWDHALTHRGYFYIRWNTEGVCDFLQLLNGSEYATF